MVMDFSGYVAQFMQLGIFYSWCQAIFRLRVGVHIGRLRIHHFGIELRPVSEILPAVDFP
jgi:hypothetical protein